MKPARFIKASGRQLLAPLSVLVALCCLANGAGSASSPSQTAAAQVVELGGDAGVGPGRWYNLKLRFEGPSITGLVDGKTALNVTDKLYERGMAGLLAGGGKTKLSTPYFDSVMVKAVNARAPKPSSAAPGQTPIYRSTEARRR